ncbi:hypothetical protein Mapa_013637 [Marchantia paleacea]|nr:hypothetical protein Mapa_013637 [Marchantia paleacea]
MKIVRFFQPFQKMSRTSQTSSVTGWIGSSGPGLEVVQKPMLLPAGCQSDSTGGNILTPWFIAGKSIIHGLVNASTAQKSGT